MAQENVDWKVSGHCTEACTSPAVCPYYWGSSTPTDLHEGVNRCEGAFSFHIVKGSYGGMELGGLNVGFAFNTPVGGTAVRGSWPAVLYIDSRADSRQATALEKIFTECWAAMGSILKVKRAPMSFTREAVGDAEPPGYSHNIKWGDVYSLKAEPLMTMNGLPRYISGMRGGLIYVGRSTENRFNDPDLPRGSWDRPQMSNTYYDFALDPSHKQWVP